MRVVDGSEHFLDEYRGCVLSIGNFDGVHLGHQAVLGSAIERARVLGCPAIAYTFDPHPRRLLAPERMAPLLMTAKQLELALEGLGIDVLVRERFTPEFASTPPHVFLRDVLRGRIEPHELFVGRDFHFGKGRGGSGETLARLAPTLGMRVVFVAEVRAGGRDVSSTRIREALARGDVSEASLCMGRPYAIWGRVVEGERRGREIGFPTANLDCDNELIPARGVYATRIALLGEDGPRGDPLASVTNVGVRPTFEEGRLLTEVHVIDFAADLYGKRMEVRFIERLRAERRFPDVAALREQISHDVTRARAILEDARG